MSQTIRVTDFRFPGCVDNVKYDPVFTSIIPFLKQNLYSCSVRSLKSNLVGTSSEMNSQISLAMVLTLCLSNAVEKENFTLGMLTLDIKFCGLKYECEYEIKYKYDFLVLVYSLQFIASLLCFLIKSGKWKIVLRTQSRACSRI